MSVRENGELSDAGKFRYADVERALAQHFMVPTAHLGMFKARIRHFQKLGIAPAKAGKGKAITYTVPDVMAIAFCINLAEMSISPSAIRKIYDSCWSRSLAGLKSSKSTQTVRLFVTASFFSEALGIAGSDAELINSVIFVDQERPDLKFFDRGLIINITALLSGVANNLPGGVYIDAVDQLAVR